MIYYFKMKMKTWDYKQKNKTCGTKYYTKGITTRITLTL